MKPEQLVQALEAAVRQLGVAVRRERGPFRSGLCQLGGETMVVLNRQHPSEAHLAALAAALQELPAEEVYLRPAVRDALEGLWAVHRTPPGGGGAA